MHTEVTHSFETLKVNALVTSSISGSVGTYYFSFMTLHILMYGLYEMLKVVHIFLLFTSHNMLLPQYRWDISFLNYILYS